MSTCACIMWYGWRSVNITPHTTGKLKLGAPVQAFTFLVREAPRHHKQAWRSGALMVPAYREGIAYQAENKYSVWCVG